MTFNGSLNGGKRSYIGGGTAAVKKQSCVHANNPYGHSRECSCGWWARERGSQTVPYYPESPYGDDLDDIDDDWEPDPWARADEIHDRERDERTFNE